MPKYDVRMVANNIPKAKKMVKRAVSRSLEDIGEAVQKHAQTIVPVDTGDLRKSIDHYVQDNTVSIGSPLEYAPYVELGTGPNYKAPPKWMENLQKRGHHLTDPWWYLDDDGTWKLGWFVRSRPYLKPSCLNYADEYKNITIKNLKNAR